MAKILIIDDDADIVEYMRVILRNRGYEVENAGSGKEGLDRIDSVNPDLVILDVMMESGDSGFDVARNIKQNPKHKNTPILMITALKEKTGFDFTKEAGDAEWLPVDDYVDKSINPDVLLEKVAKLLKKQDTPPK